jgi:uncharacterized protein (TIGR02453 family)
MPASAPLFGEELFQFLVELTFNNNRTWFAENKARYEEHVKRPLEAFAATFAPRLAKIAPGYSVGHAFRIYRDTRFAKDKTPYKTAAAVQFVRASARSDVHQPGFYVHLEPGECFAAAGIWAPDAATLARVRATIVARPAAWAPFSKLEFWGESYARPPKGVDPGHRFVDDLLRRHFLTWVDFKDRDVVGASFLGRLEKACTRMAPLVAFLDKALGAR